MAELAAAICLSMMSDIGLVAIFSLSKPSNYLGNYVILVAHNAQIKVIAMANDLIVKIVLFVLGQIINKDTVAKLTDEITKAVEFELSKLPGGVKHVETVLVAKLRDLSASTDNKLDDGIVQIVADALGVA